MITQRTLFSKWAETDLVYNKTTKTSGFASSYTDQASLYQWGRNPGWKDYIDALGGTTTDNGGVYYEMLTHNKHYNVGTGLHGGADDISYYYYDSKNDSFDELLYFMNRQGTDYWIGTGGGSTWNERAEAVDLPQAFALKTGVFLQRLISLRLNLQKL